MYLQLSVSTSSGNNVIGYFQTECVGEKCALGWLEKVLFSIHWNHGKRYRPTLQYRWWAFDRAL